MDEPSGAVPEQVQQFAPKPKPRKDGPPGELIGMLQRVAGMISDKKYERTNAHVTTVVDQPSSAIPDQGLMLAPRQPPEDDRIDKAGGALIAMLHKAAGVSNEEYDRATILAGRLASELRATENRIKELEAEASYFRDRAARAEEWLQLISREIESKLIAPLGASHPRGAGD